MLKGLPLAYSRRTCRKTRKSHLRRARHAVAVRSPRLTGMVGDLRPKPSACGRRPASALPTATDLADWLVRQAKHSVHDVRGRDHGLAYRWGFVFESKRAPQLTVSDHRRLRVTIDHRNRQPHPLAVLSVLSSARARQLLWRYGAGEFVANGAHVVEEAAHGAGGQAGARPGRCCFAAVTATAAEVDRASLNIEMAPCSPRTSMRRRAAGKVARLLGAHSAATLRRCTSR